MHLNFHCIIACDTNLTVIFARGWGVRRDCADVQDCQSTNLLLAYGINVSVNHLLKIILPLRFISVQYSYSVVVGGFIPIGYNNC